MLFRSQHDALKVQIFLPEPVDVATFAGVRLNEVVLHGWDVRVAADPAAGLLDSSASTLAEQYAESLAFLLGFIGKPAAAPEPAVVAVAGTPYSIVLDDRVRFTPDAPAATATFTGPLEAALRLMSGRLGPRFTPSGVAVSGNVSLDDLRAVFPGY